MALSKFNAFFAVGVSGWERSLTESLLGVSVDNTLVDLEAKAIDGDCKTC